METTIKLSPNTRTISYAEQDEFFSSAPGTSEAREIEYRHACISEARREGAVEAYRKLGEVLALSLIYTNNSTDTGPGGLYEVVAASIPGDYRSDFYLAFLGAVERVNDARREAAAAAR